LFFLNVFFSISMFSRLFSSLFGSQKSQTKGLSPKGSFSAGKAAVLGALAIALLWTSSRALMQNDIPAVSPQEALRLASTRADVAILDVRTPAERQNDGAISPSLFIPLQELETRLGELEAAKMKSGRLLVICRSGARSARACAILRAKGFSAENIAGGMLAWQSEGLALEFAAPAAGATQSVRENLRARADAFQTRLKETLLRNLARGFPSAVGACADSAQVLASAASDANLRVRRVSLNARNPADEPDERERAVLQRFDSLARAGALSDALGVFEEFSGEGGVRTARYMKPITIASGMCLQCHGSPSDILPETAQALDKRYPNDKARGHKLGDLRGAVSVSLSGNTK
jgi:rhodanese-related sulfurtransferase